MVKITYISAWQPSETVGFPHKCAFHSQITQNTSAQFLNMLAAPGRDEDAPSEVTQLATHRLQSIPGTVSDSLDLRQDSNASVDRGSTRKQRRTGRACDECRGRKTKCDGRQPCIHCSSLDIGKYSVIVLDRFVISKSKTACTYDKPNKRSTRLSRKEVDELWPKLQRAQHLLKSILPDIDIDDPTLNTDTLSKLRVSTAEEASAAVLKDFQDGGMGQDVPLETVLEMTGQLELDERGNWSYHGHGSSSAFIRRLGEQFGNISDSGLRMNTVLHESPENLEEQPFEGSVHDSIPLPPRDIALDLTSSALDEACAILNFIHQPTFYSMLERVYLVDREQYGYEENRFLPLLYAILAVGCLFSNSERAHFGYAHAVSEGFVTFTAACLPILLTSEGKNTLLRLGKCSPLRNVRIFGHSKASCSWLSSYSHQQKCRPVTHMSVRQWLPPSRWVSIAANRRQ